MMSALSPQVIRLVASQDGTPWAKRKHLCKGIMYKWEIFAHSFNMLYGTDAGAKPYGQAL
jgi:hypothetical protein